MKPSELAKAIEELGIGDSEDFELFKLVDANLPTVLSALRHHEALVEALEGIVHDTIDVDPLPFCLQKARAVLATIEREKGGGAVKLPKKEEAELRAGARAVAECIVRGLKNKRSREHYTTEAIADLIEAQVRAGIGREREGRS